MGDRVSISFKNGKEESVALFNHWGGMAFPVQEVKKYCEELKATLKARNSKGCYPLERLEPNTVMVDFVRWYTRDFQRVDSNLYFGKDCEDGDNSDNGHFVIECSAPGWSNPEGEVKFVCYGPCIMWEV